jgi:methionyl-tRNA formyltransferase
MRILFVGGFYRGYRLAQRLIERNEEVVGAYVYEEDAHESPKFSAEIESLFSASGVSAQRTRKITDRQLSTVREKLKPDVVFCLGWRTLIPDDILACAPLGGIAVHDSLLPRLRGFAPTNWGLILGHDQLGATLFQLTDSVDAGDIYFQEAIAPAADESFDAIQRQIAELSVRLFDQYLDAKKSGVPVGRRQNHAEATYTCARTPADGEIDWRVSSAAIARLVRALAPPAPTAFTYHRSLPLGIVAAHAVANPRNYEGRIPGRVIDRDPTHGTVDVLCGEGVLRIATVQTTDGAQPPAGSVLRSVRESLGLNHSQEIIELRARLAVLESRLDATTSESMVKKAG